MDSMLLRKNAASTNSKGSWLMCNHMEKIWYLQVDFALWYKTAYLLILQSGHQVFLKKFCRSFWLLVAGTNINLKNENMIHGIRIKNNFH